MIFASKNNTNTFDNQVSLVSKGETETFGVNLRPFLREVLLSLRKKFNLFVFTQGQNKISERLVEIIEKEGPIFSGCFYRSECTELSTLKETFFVLDFSVFDNINLDETLLIDSSIMHFAFQLGNGVPVLPFFDNKNDAELKTLAKFLMSAGDDETLKAFCKKHLKLEEKYKEINEETYNEQVFQRYLGFNMDSSYDSTVM